MKDTKESVIPCPPILFLMERATFCLVKHGAEPMEVLFKVDQHTVFIEWTCNRSELRTRKLTELGRVWLSFNKNFLVCALFLGRWITDDDRVWWFESCPIWGSFSLNNELFQHGLSELAWRLDKLGWYIEVLIFVLLLPLSRPLVVFHVLSHIASFAPPLDQLWRVMPKSLMALAAKNLFLHLEDGLCWVFHKYYYITHF